ncbi:MAG: ORF6N domain-containing protein, partial [Bacteroidales bacterium]|nr:ORF6N domain-containing protein [Bacteroidales bacterium]
AMRHFLQNNAQVFTEINFIKNQLLETNLHQKEADKRIDELFSLMDKYKVADTQGIFYQGQIFDAYAKFQSFIAQAQKDIVLIDNYVDVSVLERLATKNSGVAVTIYTSSKTKLTAQDIQNFNAQYPPLTVNYTDKMHDRFLIIDHKILYHIGASLKDLGKKCFAFDLFDASFIPDILAKV